MHKFRHYDGIAYVSASLSRELVSIEKTVLMNYGTDRSEVICRTYVRKTLISEKVAYNLEDAKQVLDCAESLHPCRGAGRAKDFTYDVLTKKLEQQISHSDGLVFSVTCKGAVKQQDVHRQSRCKSSPHQRQHEEHRGKREEAYKVEVRVAGSCRTRRRNTAERSVKRDQERFERRAARLRGLRVGRDGQHEQQHGGHRKHERRRAEKRSARDQKCPAASARPCTRVRRATTALPPQRRTPGVQLAAYQEYDDEQQPDTVPDHPVTRRRHTVVEEAATPGRTTRRVDAETATNVSEVKSPPQDAQNASSAVTTETIAEGKRRKRKRTRGGRASTSKRLRIDSTTTTTAVTSEEKHGSHRTTVDNPEFSEWAHVDKGRDVVAYAASTTGRRL
ncbi:hypothetical protein MRX96_043474 [Rhipicephalus microplus]